jgi:hypothetical protein
MSCYSRITLQKQQQTSNTTTTNTTTSSTNTTTATYMTLHARVEQDTQYHPMCPEKKVTNWTRILHMLQEMFPEPPVDHVFLPIH